MAFITSIPFLFTWWYKDGLQALFDFLTLLFVHTSAFFAPLDLLKNILAPWKKDTNEMGRGLSELKVWLADNLVSRLMGFIMRLSLLIIYAFFLLFYLLFLASSIVFWLGMPLFLVLSVIWIFI